MMNDDDDVLGIDLDAWQPPPPPAHIADGVIARLRQETTSVTVQALPVEQQHASAKRWWIIGASAIAAAATTTLVAFGMSRAPEDGRGSVASARPSHLSIGPSFADLDRDTVVSWRRERYRITAQQAGGAATWRVDDDDTLTIETALGSIEATNASLRVEVKMFDEKKTLASTAVTAAAVALVTVVVYEGVVKVRADNTATTVAPGTAYQIKATRENVIEEDEQLAVGGAPPARDLIVRIGELEAKLAEKQAQLDALEQQQRDGTMDPFATPRPVPETIDRAAISRVMGDLRAKVQACGKDFDGKLFATVRVKPDGSVEKVTTTPADAKPSDCIANAIRPANFGKTKTGGSFKYPYVFAGPAPAKNYDFSADPFSTPRPPKRTSDLSGNPFTKSCDEEQLLAKGKDAFGMGLSAAALAYFEAAYACTKRQDTLKFVFASACKAKNVAKARQTWHKMTPAQRDPLASMCVMNGITLEILDGDTTGQPGRLRVTNTVPATVLVDGAEVGTTPLDIEVPEGRHKITLVVGADKHTFAVDVKAGGTVTLNKTVE